MRGRLTVFLLMALSIVCSPKICCQTGYDDGGGPPQFTYPTPYQRPPTIQQYRYYPTPFGRVTTTTPFGAPGFSNPVPFGYGPGYYTFTSPQATYHFWRAPSGYYYPWYNYHGVVVPYGYGATSFNQGAIQPTKPSVTVVYQDLNKFLQQAKTEGKLKENDFAQLNKRLNDLISKTNSVRFQEGGTLSETSEDDLRADFDQLSREVSFRLR